MGTMYDCGRVLSSPWSALFGVPISVYAASYYAVMLGLATCVLWKPQRFLSAVRPIILAMAWVGLVVVALLGGYAAFGLRTFCLHCTVLYALGAAIFVAASLMNPGGHRAGLAALWVPNVRRRGAVLLIGGLSFLALTMVQALLYRRGAVRVVIEDRCIAYNEAGLPATTLRTAEKSPEVEIVLFLDLACPACRDEFKAWRRDVADSRGKYTLSVLHYPRESECIPPEFTARSRPSEQNHSCRGAAAVECVERMAPGKGLDMVAALFERQEGTSPYFPDVALVAAAQALGLDVSPELTDPFVECLDDPQVYSHIRTHALFGMEKGLTETPGTLFVFFEDEVPSDQTLLVKGAKDYGNIDEYLAAARLRVLGVPRNDP